MVELNKYEFEYRGNKSDVVISTSRIKNGSKFIVGGELSQLTMVLHQHFNWFQKLMWKLCFGVKIEDYSEE